MLLRWLRILGGLESKSGERRMSSATAGPPGKTHQNPTLWGPCNPCWYHCGCRRVLQTQDPSPPPQSTMPASPQLRLLTVPGGRRGAPEGQGQPCALAPLQADKHPYVYVYTLNSDANSPIFPEGKLLMAPLLSDFMTMKGDS